MSSTLDHCTARYVRAVRARRDAEAAGGDVMYADVTANLWTQVCELAAVTRSAAVALAQLADHVRDHLQEVDNGREKTREVCEHDRAAADFLKDAEALLAPGTTTGRTSR